MKRVTSSLFNAVPRHSLNLHHNSISHLLASSLNNITCQPLNIPVQRYHHLVNNNNNTIDTININRSTERKLNKLVNSKSFTPLIPRRYSTLPSAPNNGMEINDVASPPIKAEPTWVDSAPARIQPYLRLSRLDKPIGTLLLLYPCLWSTAMAAQPEHLPDIKLMLMFGAGAFLMRSAGCVINDMADYKFDRQVERTKSRPIASNQITHKEALALLAGQLAASFGLLLNFNTYTILLSLASVPIVILYPFMKRYTHYPQLVLGFAFNWGALVGYSAVKGYCDWSICLPLYVAGISWTMVYDTIYAHMDKKDDLSVGIKSTAIAFGRKSREILAGFSALTIGSLGLAGLAASVHPIYYFGIAVSAAHLAWQVVNVKFSNPKSCMKFFISNKTFALIVLVTIILSKLFDRAECELLEFTLFGKTISFINKEREREIEIE